MNFTTAMRSNAAFIRLKVKILKNKIIINLSKDTPAETLKELYAALKPKKEKAAQSKQPLYALNEDIEKLHARYEELYKQVKNSQNLSEKQIEKECDVLSRKYDFEVETLSKLREVDYDIKLAEIEQRKRNIKPWRRCWLWRLLLRPLTNRAQDIIEARAELNADIKHTAAEKEIEEKRKELPTDDDKKPSKNFIKKAAAKLKAIIKQADKADVAEAFDEPKQGTETPERTIEQQNDPRGAAAATEPQKQAKTSEPAPAAAVQTTTPKPQGNGQLQGQMTMDEKVLPPKSDRKPRPPASCRKQ